MNWYSQFVKWGCISIKYLYIFFFIHRLFMTHGQAALRPDASRICECVSLRLLKEFELARNRPKDSKGKTFPIPQSIVKSYVHIKQLLEDSLVIQEQTDLVLVTINNTTVSCW